MTFSCFAHDDQLRFTVFELSQIAEKLACVEFELCADKIRRLTDSSRIEQ